MELTVIPSPATASLWLREPISPSLRLTAPLAAPHSSLESLHDDTDAAPLQHRDTDAISAPRSPLAQSWPSWPSAAAQRGTFGVMSARSLSEEDGYFGAKQRLAAARREAQMHLRLQCSQDIIGMLEQHVCEQVWPAPLAVHPCPPMFTKF